MKFDNIEDLFKMLDIAKDNDKSKNDIDILNLVFESSFNSLKKMNDNTKVKMGDFYDPVNDVYYNAIVNVSYKIIIPSDNNFDISKSTKIMRYEPSNRVRMIYVFDGLLIVENIDIYTGEIDTLIYDESVLEYLCKLQYIKTYSDMLQILRICKSENILPDIELNSRLCFEGKSAFIFNSYYELSNVRSGYLAYRQELSNAIEDYKSKKKKFIRF